MEKDRQTKIIAIVALFIGVITMTVGFAAFSTRLIIQSKASVKPNTDSFKVVLSKEQSEEVVGNVIPSGNGEEAMIGNTGDSTISGLKANFVNPGEKVEYEFFAVNVGELDAYLNRIEYETVSGSTENKVCTASEGTSIALVEKACESIRVTVKVAEEDKACQTSTYGAHKLSKKTGEKVLVTIEYAHDGSYVDGPFEVEFGDISINYSPTDSETKNVSACADYNSNFAAKPFDTLGRGNIADLDGNGKITLGDKVTLGTESFYVMSTNETAGTVTMFAEWNLNVGVDSIEGEIGMQNSACKGWLEEQTESQGKCILPFAETNYWSSATTTYPAYIYNSQSNLYPHVENYVKKLQEAGYNSVSGRLIKVEELVDLGCVGDGVSEGTCNSAPSWIKNTTYWSGTAYDSTKFWGIVSDGRVNGYVITAMGGGVRPVITISASEI